MKKLYERAYVFFQKYPLMISIGYMCIYFPIFSLLEQFCEPRYVIHCALDDMIPFNEWFVIPYVIWFAFVPGMVLFFLRKSKEDYIKCCKVIYGGMSICLLIYYLFPNGLSTVVIDQHSVVDAVCGMMLSAVLFYLVQLSEVPDQVTVFEEVKR